jgi:hypothetical protein
VKNNNVNGINELSYDELHRLYMMTDNPIDPFPKYYEGDQSDDHYPHTQQTNRERDIMVESINKQMSSTEELKVGA